MRLSYSYPAVGWPDGVAGGSIHEFASCLVSPAPCLRSEILRGSYVRGGGYSLNSRAIFNQLRKSDIPYEIGLSNRGADTLVGSSYGDHKV